MNKLNLSYDGIWNDQEKVWKGSLTFQQIYPLVLKRATAEDMGPAVHKPPQEDAINAVAAPYVQQEGSLAPPRNNWLGNDHITFPCALKEGLPTNQTELQENQVTKPRKLFL